MALHLARENRAGRVSLALKIKKEDGRMDWNLPAKKILNRLRAFTPWPGGIRVFADGGHCFASAPIFKKSAKRQSASL
jgi:methionyl-tRNA formyltransferase